MDGRRWKGRGLYAAIVEGRKEDQASKQKERREAERRRGGEEKEKRRERANSRAEQNIRTLETETVELCSDESAEKIEIYTESRAGQGRAGQSRSGQSRSEQSRAEQGSGVQNI